MQVTIQPSSGLTKKQGSLSMSKPISQPKPEPIFILDLGENGGYLSPINLQDFQQWIQKEQAFWSWASQRQRGNHEQGFRQRIDQLGQALSNIQQSSQHELSNPQHAKNLLESSKGLIQEIFLTRKFPHSSTPLAQRINIYRLDAGDTAASFMLAVFFPPDQSNQIQATDLNSWRGLVEGIADRFQLVPSIQKGRKAGAEQSFEQLRLKLEQLLGEKSTAYESLHRDYIELAEGVRKTSQDQTTDFDRDQKDRQDQFEKAVEKHTADMDALRKAFREEMGLRAPAEYWETKRKRHVLLTWVTGLLSFASIGGAAWFLFFSIHDLVSATPAGKQPESWRLAGLALIALFAVWGIRLLVRMFLSNMHLMTDAAERVVMLKTYLSLAEGDQLANKDDRQLILQALFRPTSDGLVKDEGIPASFFEMLTRGPKP